jgi:glycogen debranching enzyme
MLSEARTRFLEPIESHLQQAGLGHISEITDAEPPYTPAGCPFQAWSVGEALRLMALLADKPAATRRSAKSTEQATKRPRTSTPQRKKKKE